MTVVAPPAARPTESRLPGGLLPWVAGNLVVLALFLLDYRFFKNGLIHANVAWGRDFANVWTAGKAVLGGQVGLLYDLKAYHHFQQSLFGPIGIHNYSYPPLTLPLMVPFGLLPYGVALAAWLISTGWLFVRAASPWWRERAGLPVLLVLLTPAALANVWAGHYGFLMGALLLFGWHALERGRPYLAGLCFGLMAIKPHLAVLVPLILMLRGEWRALAMAAITVAVLVAISLLLFGMKPWHDFLTITLSFQASLINANGSFFRLMSTSTSTALLGLHCPRAITNAIQLLVSATGVVIVARVARRAALADVAMLAATATFLVLPYAFNYDLTVSAMGAALLMRSGTQGPLERIGAIAGFMAAQLGMLLAALGLPLMPVLLIGLAFVQYRVAMRGAAVDPTARRDGRAGEALAHSA